MTQKQWGSRKGGSAPHAKVNTTTEGVWGGHYVIPTRRGTGKSDLMAYAPSHGGLQRWGVFSNSRYLGSRLWETKVKL